MLCCWLADERRKLRRVAAFMSTISAIPVIIRNRTSIIRIIAILVARLQRNFRLPVASKSDPQILRDRTKWEPAFVLSSGSLAELPW